MDGGDRAAIARAAAGDLARGAPELPREIVDQAMAQERARRAAGAAVPESVRERLPDELLAGRTGQTEVLGRDGCSAS